VATTVAAPPATVRAERSAAESKHAPDAAASAAAAAPASLEAWLRNEMASVTGFPPTSIDRDASFDELGIDSLALAQLLERLMAHDPSVQSKMTALYGAKSLAGVVAALGPAAPEPCFDSAALRSAPTGAAVPAAAPPAAAEATDVASVEGWFRAHLARVTGFPSEGIDLDAPLDDLGIDSLAKAVLLEEVIGRFPEVRAEVQHFFKVRSTRDAVALVESIGKPAATAAPATPVPAERSEAESKATARAERSAAESKHAPAAPATDWSPAVSAIRQRALAALAGRESPPAEPITDATRVDALGLNDFELDALWKEAIAGASPFALAGEAILSASTLGEALALLAGLERPAEPAAAAMPDALARYVRVEVARPSPPGSAPLPSRLLLVGAPDAAFERFRAALGAAGVAVEPLHVTQDGWRTAGGDAFPLEAHDVLSEHLLRAHRADASMPIVFLTQGEAASLSATSAEAWAAQVDVNAVGLFCVAKALAAANMMAAHRHLGVVLCGGAGPASVAARGVARSLSHEWRGAGITVASLELEDAAAVDPVQAIRILIAHDGTHDLALRGEQLWEARIERRDEPFHGEAALPLTRDSVVLLFGGGVGIGAEIGIALAKRYGCTIAALGRTAWKGQMPYPEAASDAAMAEAVFAELKARSGAAKVPAAELNDALKRARRQRDLARTAERVAAAGGRFEYVCADVTNADDVERALERVRGRSRQIDLVLHAAGVVDDRLVRSKSVESFRRVLHTKARSAFHLHRAFRDAPPKCVAFLSSLISHTGNVGQTDYAAGNEVLNAVAHAWAREGATRVVSLLWSVWTETGLAGPGVKSLMERHALAGITSADGVRYSTAELARTDGPDWVLVTSPKTLEVLSRGVGAAAAA
jgi:NADP-dependent 3-hydroxy acid dehydrogenase YdfG/acyl carrier protein